MEITFESMKSRTKESFLDLEEKVLVSLISQLQDNKISNCSYKQNLRHYLDKKIAFHHLNIAYNYERIFYDDYLVKSELLKREMEEFNLKMYEKPCKVCLVCLTRKRKWPT